MMTVQVLGSGCAKCHQLADNVKQAIVQLGMECRFEIVADPDKIAEAGVFFTPALMVDGKVKSVGKVLTAEQAAGLLKT